MAIKNVNSKKLHTKILHPERSVVMGVDSSTTGIAWTTIHKGVPYGWGKVDTSKIKDMHDKLAFVAEEWSELIKNISPDMLVIEQSIFVSNPLTARKLAYVVGAVIALTLNHSQNPDTMIEEVEPIKWKNWLGYQNITTKMERAAQANLGASEGKKLCDRLRKSQTYNVIRDNFHNFETDDNDVADSCGIALWGWEQVISPLRMKVIKDVAFPPQDRATLGL